MLSLHGSLGAGLAAGLASIGGSLLLGAAAGWLLTRSGRYFRERGEAEYASEFLQRKYGGRGVTIGHIDHVKPARVLIIGGGAVGRTAAKTAAGMGARTTLLDIDPVKVEEL